MSKNTSSSSSAGGIGFVGALTILFIALKLTHVIDWSWWWVLAPLWIGAILGVVILLIVVVAIILLAWREQRKTQSRLKEMRNRRFR